MTGHGDADLLVQAASKLCRAVNRLRFAPPVAQVYNPLDYAWAPHELYLRKFGHGPKSVIFLGMNPGPFGMVQTGVPFGEIDAVSRWLGIKAPVQAPASQHPARAIVGFDCTRSEVSGQRLWGLFEARFSQPERFFARHLVVNYCPLAFLECSGRNRTPDKLPATERQALFEACDQHLRTVVRILRADWVVGVGDFAFRRTQDLFTGGGPRLGRILHPSPASPLANRNWAATATAQLQELGIWQ